jgi:hypothetical protein
MKKLREAGLDSCPAAVLKFLMQTSGQRFFAKRTPMAGLIYTDCPQARYAFQCHDAVWSYKL